MCGITGLLEFNNTSISEDVLNRMTDAMEHRGPDGRGVWIKNGIGFGHRRLSIIDIGGGHQPMVVQDGQFALTFNGEIYNYIELRQELVKKGVVFETSSDTEVLIWALITWGRDALARLNGMFAFAFWDARKRTLLLARDHMGIKPLYFSCDSNRLLFGSDLTSIVAHPEFKREIDKSAFSHFMSWRVIPYPFTIYEGVKQVSPGSYIEISGTGKRTEGKYWDIPTGNISNFKSDNEYREELESLLEDALSLQVRSDVPVGAFLSGGVDSSAVAYYMMKAQKGKGNTFTIGFGGAESDFDESKWAADVAKSIDSKHFLHVAKDYQIEPLLQNVTWFFGQPNGTGIPNYFVSEMARKHIKVALSGVGPDECFAGYRRFQAANKPHIFPYGTNDHEDIFLKSLLSFKPEDKQSIFSSDLLSEVRNEDSLEFIRQQNAHYSGTSALNKLSCLDLRHYMHNDLLFNLDRMSMAHSLEVRVPLLDYRIVEFAMRVPEHLKIRNWEQKVVMKQAMYQHLPKHVFLRKKHGFSLPKEAWILRIESFIRDTITKDAIDKHGLLKWSEVKMYMDRVFASEHRVSWRDASNLWNVLAFEMWAQMFFDREQVPLKPPASTAIEFD